MFFSNRSTINKKKRTNKTNKQHVNFFKIVTNMFENLDWNFILLTKIHMRLTRSKFDVHNLLLTFDFFVHICFLNQIFSLCYLFFEHAFDIIFDFHRDERCKIHTRYRKRSANKKKQNRSIRDDCTFSTRTFRSISWRFYFQHEIFLSIRNDDDSLFFAQQISRFEFCEINWHSIKFSVETDCSSKYANKKNKIVKRS